MSFVKPWGRDSLSPGRAGRSSYLDAKVAGCGVADLYCGGGGALALPPDLKQRRTSSRAMSALGHNRKSVMAMRMSAFGGRAEVDFGRRHVCL